VNKYRSLLFLLTRAIVPALVTISIIGCSAPKPQTPDEHLAYAANQLAQGASDEAIRSYRIVLLQDSLDYRALTGLVKAYKHKGNNHSASIYRRKVVESSYIEGLEALQAGLYPQAQKHFETALGVVPDYSLALNRLGDIQLALGDSSAALKLYRRSIESDPHFAATHNTLGELLLALGQLAQAQAAFDQAIDLDINHIDAYLGLGRLYELQKKWNKSAAQYKTALLIDPESAAGNNGLERARNQL
jgi:tetratricopeptide (TPR) repeat protein